MKKWKDMSVKEQEEFNTLLNRLVERFVEAIKMEQQSEETD